MSDNYRVSYFVASENGRYRTSGLQRVLKWNHKNHTAQFNSL